MSDPSGHKNFIEAKIIIQEFHNDATVFVIGSAPFGKIWFDNEKISKQYDILLSNWYEEYDETSEHSKKPRIISVLLDATDSIFDDYRDTIREAQERKNNIENEDEEMNPTNDTITSEVEDITINEQVELSNDIGITDTQDDCNTHPPIPPIQEVPVVKEKKARKPRAKKDTATNEADSLPKTKKSTKPKKKKDDDTTI